MSQSMDFKFSEGNLVLYHNTPARIVGFKDSKIEIETKGNKLVKVRSNDIIFLHPGPIHSLSQIELLQANVTEACELLYGEVSSLKFVAEIIYNEFSPSSAWSVYSLLSEGIYLKGDIDKIQVRSRNEYEKDILIRNAKATEKKNWLKFIEDLKLGKVSEENKKRLCDLQDFALSKTKQSLILKELNIQMTEENAHSLLLKLEFWNELKNPYPERFGFNINPKYPEFKECHTNERLNLTHLNSYAIDDEGNFDPDDAISIDGNKLWIHIADVASIVEPDSENDIHARTYGSTLYIPERTTTMLSPLITSKLGLGLNEISPSLSFCISFNEEGGVEDFEIHIALVKVIRLTYAEAEDMLFSYPFNEIFSITQKYRDYRKKKNATFLSFPEVKIKVVDGKVNITPYKMFKSRDMVAEAMMIAGEAAAKFAIKNSIPFPFITQPSPEIVSNPETIADMFAYRKLLKPSLTKCSPDIHAGLGLDAYCRVTSPLRRYIDLINHQQLRAFLNKGRVMSEDEIMMRIGSYNAVIGMVQKVERFSNQHWTMVFLLQNPKWMGEAIVVEHKERFSIILISELNLESRITLTKDIPLNSIIKIALLSVDLPYLRAFFKII